MGPDVQVRWCTPLVLGWMVAPGNISPATRALIFDTAFTFPHRLTAM